MLKSRIVIAAALLLGSALIAVEPASAAGGCGPGAWRGPWGHCRNTPYHGRLPDGSWKRCHRQIRASGLNSARAAWRRWVRLSARW